MSDALKHECAVALIKLRQRPEYYLQKYGTPFYGFQKLTLLLEKQHNRGQDGAGMAAIRFNPEIGVPAFQLERSIRNLPLADLVERIGPSLSVSSHSKSPFGGDLFLGHLRYATYGSRDIEACQPQIHESPCLNRTLMLAGNFNLTNAQHVLHKLTASGHHVHNLRDSSLVLQWISHCLEHKRNAYQSQCDFAEILQSGLEEMDGAYTFCGATGNGEAFAIRDPAGIRPGYFYFDDEVVVVASERAPIQTVFDRTSAEVMELPPGKALIMTQDNQVEIKDCLSSKPHRKCVFERIYFSRGNDADIHQERKALGAALIPAISEAVQHDFENTFFSYIPNTAQICFHGLLQTLIKKCPQELRFGQIAIKDAKFRTFISDETVRKDLAMHVYDVTYGLVRPGADNLVVIDDSIVRGNTMKRAILPMLDRLNPKRIVIASSAPPIRYPDCYGIDMGSMRELIAFEALVDLLKKHNKMEVLEQAYNEAKRQLSSPHKPMTNCVTPIYDEFSEAELIQAITDRLRPEGLRAELVVIFQTEKSLHESCPNHSGDWYFTGNYPTSGGYRVVNQALVNYYENNHTRAYQ